MAIPTPGQFAAGRSRSHDEILQLVQGSLDLLLLPQMGILHHLHGRLHLLTSHAAKLAFNALNAPAGSLPVLRSSRPLFFPERLQTLLQSLKPTLLLLEARLNRARQRRASGAGLSSLPRVGD